MVLDVLKLHLEKKKISGKDIDWVSNKNKTIVIYECILSLEKEKRSFIKRHSFLTHFKRKKDYQINLSEVARLADVSVQTLAYTSKYSSGVKVYIEEVNKNLEKLKIDKIIKHKRLRNNGVNFKPKDELATELREAKLELKRLMDTNVEKQLTLALAKLSLPVRRKLGVNIK